MKTLCAATVSTVMLASGGAAAHASTPTLTFRPCTETTEAGLQCATLRVPLDYSQPNGPQISIAVVRHVPTSDETGTLFWNPGGPGGSGTQTLAAVLSDFTPDELAHDDIVSFDPRGIGESDQLQCYPTYAQEEAALADVAPGYPVGAAQTQAEIGAWAAFDQACASHGGPIQDHMGTADVARDMDRIRQALGVSEIDYDGISYGTYLGVTYANLFPSHVAHMVLDGNVNPLAWNDALSGSQVSTFDRLNSPLGSELGFQLFISDCAAAGTSGCPFAAGSDQATLAKWRTLKQRLTRQPVTVDGLPFTAAYLTLFSTGGLESVQPVPALGEPGWSGVAQVLQDVWTASGASAGHRVISPELRRLLTPGHTALGQSLGLSGVSESPGVSGLAAGNGYPVTGGAEGTYGVLCSESPNPTDAESYAGQAALYDQLESPDGAGSTWTWVAEPCAQWQAREAAAYSGPWTNLPASRYLVIGTLADSNTAYISSLEMAAAVGGARLLTEAGGGHTSFLNQSTCVNDAIDAFFANGTLPAPGTVCNQNQPPF